MAFFRGKRAIKGGEFFGAAVDDRRRGENAPSFPPAVIDRRYRKAG
jgi:hypothetical protein